MESIFDKLPNHLHLARNENAPEYDRFRLYSVVNKNYLEQTAAPTAEDCMKKYIEWMNEEKRKWKEL